MASAPQYRPRRTFSKFDAIYTTIPLAVSVVPKRIMEPIPALRLGRRGTQPVATQKPIVEVSGTAMDIATSAQYPHPALAPPIATAVPTTHDPVSITDSVVKRISRWSRAEC